MFPFNSKFLLFKTQNRMSIKRSYQKTPKRIFAFDFFQPLQAETKNLRSFSLTDDIDDDSELRLPRLWASLCLFGHEWQTVKEEWVSRLFLFLNAQRNKGAAMRTRKPLRWCVPFLCKSGDGGFPSSLACLTRSGAVSNRIILLSCRRPWWVIGRYGTLAFRKVQWSVEPFVKCAVCLLPFASSLALTKRKEKKERERVRVAAKVVHSLILFFYFYSIYLFIGLRL